jgi:hypothetical protein
MITALLPVGLDKRQDLMVEGHPGCLLIAFRNSSGSQLPSCIAFLPISDVVPGLTRIQDISYIC